MVVRVRRGKSGLSQYLRDGKKAASIYSREDKDIIEPIMGSLDDFERAENYCVQNKNWSENYMHITFGFSDNDYQKIESLPTKEQQISMMKNLVQDYIKHHFSGYDIDNNIISYSELHYPKLKYDEHGNKRYPHIHLGISFLNPLSDTKNRNLFAKNSYYDEVMGLKSISKYGFEKTERREFRIKNFYSQVGRDRNEWIELLDELNDRQELIHFLENQMNFKEGIDYRVVDTKNNNYVKLINKSYKTDKSGKKIIQDINLQGRGFERFVDVNGKEVFTDMNCRKIAEQMNGDLDDYSAGIGIYRELLNRLGIKKSQSEMYEEFQKIFKEMVKIEECKVNEWSKKKGIEEWKR